MERTLDTARKVPRNTTPPSIPVPESPGIAETGISSTSSALTRLLQILNMFTVDHPQVQVEEVVAAFGVGQSTAYRYLRELSDAGLVAAQGKGAYSLGRRIVELERILQLADPLLLAGKPVLESLAPHCANRAFLLCTPYNERVLCVHKVGADELVHQGRSMPIQRGRGTSFPLFRGAGSQIILAHLPSHQIKSLFLGNHTEIAEAGLGSTWVEFRTMLSSMRKVGHAKTVGRVNPGMYSVAVPILRNDGRVAGSLLMLGAVDEDDRALELVPLLQQKALEIAAPLAQSDD
jgi:DNA-binding IclR family transcriptional regulator